MRQRHRLGDLQLAIMQVLWEAEAGEATVVQIHRTLFPERGLALTTIATMLRKLEDKGVVTHRTQGRQFVYRPLVDEAAVRHSMAGELTDRVFRGDVTALVAQLLDAKSIDPDELARLRALIDAKERQMEANHG